MSTEENKSLVLRLYDEVWNKGNLNAIDEYVSPDFIEQESEYDPAKFLGANSVPGREGLKQSAMALRAAFPDVRVTFGQQIAEGDRVVTPWKAEGNQTGPLGRVPPTGRRATVTGVWIDRVADGKIVESSEEWNVFGLLAQLGLIPVPQQQQQVPA